MQAAVGPSDIKWIYFHQKVKWNIISFKTMMPTKTPLLSSEHLPCSNGRRLFWYMRPPCGSSTWKG